MIADQADSIVETLQESMAKQFEQEFAAHGMFEGLSKRTAEIERWMEEVNKTRELAGRGRTPSAITGLPKQNVRSLSCDSTQPGSQLQTRIKLAQRLARSRATSRDVLEGGRDRQRSRDEPIRLSQCPLGGAALGDTANVEQLQMPPVLPSLRYGQ